MSGFAAQCSLGLSTPHPKRLKLIHKENRYFWEGGKETRDLPKQAGFRWDSLEQHWTTDDPLKAARLVEYADDALKAHLQPYVDQLLSEAAKPYPRMEKQGDWYIWIGSIEHKDIPKRANFHWNPTAKRWETQDFEAAYRLLGYAYPDSLKAALQTEQVAAKHRMEEALAASRAIDVDITLPRPEGLEYLGYQRAGIAFALEHQAVLIADEQGLGKTIQALGIVNTDESIRSMLVVCPVSVKLNWIKEAQKWLVRPVRPFVCAGIHPNLEAFEAARQEAARTEVIFFVVINYDVLHSWAEPLRSVIWDLLVADEAHYCKDPKARRSVYLMGGQTKEETVSPIPARRRVALTGTPIVNRPIELWPIIHWLAPETFSNFWQYARRYCNAKNNGWGWDFSGAANLEELQTRLRTSIMVRRLKSEVLKELPAKFRQVVEIPANGASKAIAAENALLEQLEERLEELQIAVELAKASEDPKEYKAALAALRQGMMHAFSEIARVRHDTAVAKIPYAIEHLRNMIEGGNKVIFFAHHRDVLEAVYRAFREQAVLIYGGISDEARQEAVERFQGNESVRLFIGGITAAAEGITLTAATQVVFGELDWRPGKMLQAEDRAHRIGQHNNVLVQMLVLEGSIDARIAAALVAKMEIIERALDREGAGVQAPEQIEVLQSKTENPILPLISPDELVREESETPIVPLKRPAATANTSYAQVAEEAVRLSHEQIKAIHQGLRLLAGLDQDFASERNNVGFSKIDVRIGHSLASQSQLSPRQAVLGLRLVQKYRRQLPPELLATALEGG